MQSYNHPAWQYPRTTPPHHAASLNVPPAQLPPRPRFMSISSPAPYTPETTAALPQPSIPPSLTPGSQRAKIWDRTATQRPRTAGSGSTSSLAAPYFSPQRSSLYGDYFSPQPPPPLPFHQPPPLPTKPQALLKPLTNSLPPIPPKPSALVIAPASRIPLYPTSIPLPVAAPSKPPEPLDSEALPTPDEEEIEMALSLSATEARKREQELIAQEEEELARALEESRLLSTTVYALDEKSSPSMSPRPPSVDRPSASIRKPTPHRSDGESWLHLITPTSSTASQYSTTEGISSHASANQAESDSDPTVSFRRTPIDAQSTGEAQDTSPAPPLYANIISSTARSPLLTPPVNLSPVAPPSSSATASTYLQSDYAASSDRVLSSPSSPLTQSNSNEYSPMPSFVSRPSWSSISSEIHTSAGRSLGSELVSPISGYRSPTQPPASPDLSLGPSNLDTLDEDAEEQADTEPGPSTRPTVPLSANYYVEREMLLGVSMGFAPPVISTELVPMAGSMPNVITLPYGKAPVFHFQAPSWRTLLKLMAKLSGTRVEPTVEALSVAKHDLKLRTVIQFVKVHHSASEWRTVLYLTTDCPAPANVPNVHRYTNGDVSVLPYSYGLSPLAPLLRDGPESAMAKYYVVPSTPMTPYPKLPIDFPNLAMYLQSAVRDSRRAGGDSSSGLRKLAQYVDGCYQTETERVGSTDGEGAPKKGGMAFMFKRVMGRNKTSRSGGGNDEIYDLVTPFVSDEWG